MGEVGGDGAGQMAILTFSESWVVEESKKLDGGKREVPYIGRTAEGTYLGSKSEWNQQTRYVPTMTEKVNMECRLLVVMEVNTVLVPQDKSFIGRVGIDNIEDPTDEMTASIRHRRVSEMARLFLLTCPGDWSSAQEVRLGSVLRRYAAGEEVYIDWGLDVVATIQFRWELALIADRLVELVVSVPLSTTRCILGPDPGRPQDTWVRDSFVVERPRYGKVGGRYFELVVIGGVPARMGRVWLAQGGPMIR